MRWALAALLAILFTFVLAFMTGCGEASVYTGPKVSERVVDLTDGRKVTCLLYQYGAGAGMSCDWDGVAGQSGLIDEILPVEEGQQ